MTVGDSIGFREGRDRKSVSALRAVALVAMLGATAACATRATEPQVVAAAPRSSAAVRGTDGSHDYASTLAAIADRFERDLSLPRVEVTLRLYASRKQFQQGLIESGYTHALAREAASGFHAIGGARTVMVNESQISQYPWDQRVRLLAHELAHSVQYRLAGGVRGSSDQWLREGFADYVSCQATSRLGYGSFERLRDSVLAPLGEVAIGSRPAPLRALRTFTQWVRAQSRFDVPLYAQAYAAAEMLIEDKGMAAVLAYFEASRPSTDPETNFAKAFGLPLGRFEAAFGQRWHVLLNERGQRESAQAARSPHFEATTERETFEARPGMW